MQNKSPLIDAWQAELKKSGIPATSASNAALALCRVIDQQLYMRDRAHGDLIAQVERLKADVNMMKHSGDEV